MKNGHLVIEDKYSEHSSVVVYRTEAPEPEADFAMEIIERYALVSAQPDGEDSAGRSKLALLPPDAVVGRACEIAEKAFAEFRRRGWMQALPAIRKLKEDGSPLVEA